MQGRRFRDLLWGLRLGFGIGFIFSVWAAIQRLLFGPDTFARYHATFASVEALYLGGGIVSGSLVGLLRPITRNPFGAAFTGFVAVIPVYLGYRVTTDGFSPWTMEDSYVLVTAGLALGCLPALIFLRQSQTQTPKSTNPFS